MWQIDVHNLVWPIPYLVSSLTFVEPAPSLRFLINNSILHAIKYFTYGFITFMTSWREKIIYATFEGKTLSYMSLFTWDKH